MLTDPLNDPDHLFKVYGQGLRIRVAASDRPDSTDHAQKAMTYALKHAHRGYDGRH